MNTYIVTWLDTHDNIMSEQVEAYDVNGACWCISCRPSDIISVIRIYNKVQEAHYE